MPLHELAHFVNHSKNLDREINPKGRSIEFSREESYTDSSFKPRVRQGGLHAVETQMTHGVPISPIPMQRNIKVESVLVASSRSRVCDTAHVQ